MKNTIKILLALVVALVGFQAHALLITAPSYVDCLADPNCYLGPSGPPASNPSIGVIEQTILNQGGPAVSLFELYKKDAGAGFDSGTFASSYDTFFIPPGSPDDAYIRYVGGTSITCPECFLLVKDGASVPNWYVFDIGDSWNGTDTINMQNFWPGVGSISHVTLFGATAAVPEPGIFALLGIGLVGLGLRRFRQIRNG